MTDDAPQPPPPERAGPPEPPRRRPPSQSEIRGISTIASLPRDERPTPPAPHPVPTPDTVDDAGPAAGGTPAGAARDEDPPGRTDR